MIRESQGSIAPVDPLPGPIARTSNSAYPPGMSPSLRSTLIMLLICLLAAGHIWWLSFICDDAFISFRYAKNLAEGNGLVFNVGERVEGYTNFSWVLVSAAVLALGGRPEVWSLWISAVIAVLALLAAMRVLHAQGRDFVFFGLLVATNGGLAAWATGGLETYLFTALVLGAFLSCDAAFRRGASGAPLWYSLGFLVLASLTRPEGVLVTSIIGLFLLIQKLRRRVSVKTLVLWILIWLVAYGAFILWRSQYYGQLLPHTFHVKASGIDLLPLGLGYLLTAITRFHLYLVLLPLIALLLWRRPTGIGRETSWLAALLVTPYALYVSFVGGDFMDMSRFLVPILPILLLVAGSTWRPFHSFLATRFTRTAAVLITGALLALTIGLNLRTSWDSQKVWYRNGQDSIGQLREYSVEWKLVAEHLRSTSQPTDTLATSAAGIIPYYTGLYTIDQLGIVAGDLDSFRKLPIPRPGHSLLMRGADLIAMRPQIILGHPNVAGDPNRIRLTILMEEETFGLLEREYRTNGVKLSADPPRYIAYALRKDLVGARGR
jgi:hypothetical protein